MTIYTWRERLSQASCFGTVGLIWAGTAALTGSPLSPLISIATMAGLYFKNRSAMNRWKEPHKLIPLEEALTDDNQDRLKPKIAHIQKTAQSLSERFQNPTIGTVTLANDKSHLPNAYADGGLLRINKPMLDVFDEEAIDAVLAHETGHTLAGHERKYFMLKTLNQTWWMMILIDNVVSRILDAEPISLGSFIVLPVIAYCAANLKRVYERHADRLATTILPDEGAHQKVLQYALNRTLPKNNTPTIGQRLFDAFVQIHDHPQDRIDTLKQRFAPKQPHLKPNG